MFGTPLVYLINVMARLLGYLLRIDHKLEKPFKTIVISKFVGLGSIIQATPLIQTLHKQFPDAKLVFVSTQGNAALLKHIPEISTVLTISDKNFFKVVSTSLQLLTNLWRLKPDLFIDLEFYSNYSSIITTLSKATNRLGFYKQDKAYRKGVYNYLVPFSVETPISEAYLQFAALVNCKTTIHDLKIAVHENNYTQTIFEKTGLITSEDYIVINPNASDLRLERRWPKESYVELIGHLLHTHPLQKIILIGNAAEASYVDSIVSEIPDNANLINTAGKLNLGELIFLLAQAGLLITNDTGPMHIAFATNTKTVCLFGPCSPVQYGAVKNSVTIYKKVHCSPCVHSHVTPPCHGNNICMKNISIIEVKQAVTQADAL